MEKILIKDIDGCLFALRQCITDEKYLLDVLQLDADDLSRLEKISSPKRRSEWLTSRYLLTQIFEEPTKVYYEESGRPYINKGRLSISHSGEYVAILFSEDRKVGLDLEKATERVGRLASRFISDDESYFLTADLFSKTLVWSAKEALYKIDHNDLYDFKKSFEIEKFVIDLNGGSFFGKVKADTFIKRYKLYYFIFNEIVIVCVNN